MSDINLTGSWFEELLIAAGTECLVAVVFSKSFEQLVVVSTDAGAKKITNNNNNNNQALFTVSLH